MLELRLQFGILPLHSPMLTRVEICYLVFFVGWLGKAFHGNAMGPLWSISCEEVFYLLWAALGKLQAKGPFCSPRFSLFPSL